MVLPIGAEHAKPPAGFLGPFSSKAEANNYISDVFATKPERDAQVIKDARLFWDPNNLGVPLWLGGTDNINVVVAFCI